MSALSSEDWPWLALAGLGAFHGLNPGMGWLFAVALGLHRKSRSVLLLSLAPIALGHAAAAAVVLGTVMAVGRSLEHAALSAGAGLLLLSWAAWHAFYGHRQRVRIGMQTGLVGLAAWSFLMASAHGAGLMLVPILLPLCGAPGSAGAPASLTASGLAGLGVHTAAMLATIAIVSVVVYDWSGVGFLRRGWINFDAVWTAALAISGGLLLVL